MPTVLASQSTGRRNSRRYRSLLILWLIIAVAPSQPKQEGNVLHKSASKTEANTEEVSDPLGRTLLTERCSASYKPPRVATSKKPLSTSSCRKPNGLCTANSLRSNCTNEWVTLFWDAWARSVTIVKVQRKKGFRKITNGSAYSASMTAELTSIWCASRTPQLARFGSSPLSFWPKFRTYPVRLKSARWNLGALIFWSQADSQHNPCGA
jgi:hypothetical protein